MVLGIELGEIIDNDIQAFWQCTRAKDARRIGNELASYSMPNEGEQVIVASFA